jgi:hypothetical protein
MNAIGHTHSRFKRAGVGTKASSIVNFCRQTRTVRGAEDVGEGTMGAATTAIAAAGNAANPTPAPLGGNGNAFRRFRFSAAESFSLPNGASAESPPTAVATSRNAPTSAG